MREVVPSLGALTHYLRHLGGPWLPVLREVVPSLGALTRYLRHFGEPWLPVCER